MTAILTVSSAVIALFFAAAYTGYAQVALRAAARTTVSTDTLYPYMALGVIAFAGCFGMSYSFWIWHLRSTVLDLGPGDVTRLLPRVLSHPWSWFVLAVDALFFALVALGDQLLMIEPWLVSWMPAIMLVGWLAIMVWVGALLVMLPEEVP